MNPLNDTVEENSSDKDSSFELKDQCNLQISNDQEHIAQESGEQSQQTSNVDVVCNQELINKVKVNDRIQIRENDQGTWTNVKILGLVKEVNLLEEIDSITMLKMKVKKNLEYF